MRDYKVIYEEKEITSAEYNMLIKLLLQVRNEEISQEIHKENK